MKKCTKCKIEKPSTEFHKDKRSKSGYQFRCKQCLKDYHKENLETRRKYEKKYRNENKEKAAEYAKQYRLDNLEYRKEYIKQWFKVYNRTPKGIAANALKKAKRRYKEKQLINEWTLEIEEQMKKDQDFKCKICGKLLGDDIHRDHIIPVSKQVKGGLGLHPDNVQLTHGSCNQSKGVKMDNDELLKDIEYLAMNGGSFDFLNDEEDIYTSDDGEPIFDS